MGSKCHLRNFYSASNWVERLQRACAINRKPGVLEFLQKWFSNFPGLDSMGAFTITTSTITIIIINHHWWWYITIIITIIISIIITIIEEGRIIAAADHRSRVGGSPGESAINWRGTSSLSSSPSPSYNQQYHHHHHHAEAQEGMQSNE